jgi:N-(2-amino-2-carboxyethyl)-L-glutamate synthase
VPIISTPQAFNEEDLYVDLRSIFGQPLFLKCEGFNFAGSIKLKAAAEMVEAAERDELVTPESVLVESSSGNLGVALSMLAASKGYRFLCVTDSRCNLSTRLMMEALGSQVHVITEPDAKSGFLGARLDYLRALCASDDRYVWLNQYTNPDNWKAHYRTTAPAIARQFPQLDVLFVGAGTTGTLMGCARWFRQWHRPVRVVAVDSVGSVTFGGEPGRRRSHHRPGRRRPHAGGAGQGLRGACQPRPRPAATAPDRGAGRALPAVGAGLARRARRAGGARPRRHGRRRHRGGAPGHR